MYDFSVHYNAIDKSDIWNIPKCLMIQNNIIVSLIKQVFIVLLIFTKSFSTKCMSLTNEPCKTRPFLVDFNFGVLKYYPFMINLDKSNVSCNAVDDLSTNLHVPDKTKRVNVKVHNMTTRINESKTLMKHIW